MTLSPQENEVVEESTIESLPLDEFVEPERTAPERIGRYELCFELASGGMASVYLARIDGVSGFEKLVALKRIHRHLAKEQGYVDMFLDEARIAARITHPNVCSVFDFGEADGEYYIAMEYLVGEPLSRLCGRVARNQEQRRHRLLPLRMSRIIADACEGLHAAHELKDANGDLLHVVHRDVSPRNLFVTYDGAAQVVDFGIASARQRLHHTSTGQVKGTFAYMAPEQLTARPIDRRVDVWALGVTLWEMLAVKRLFRRDTTANTIHAVLYDEVLPPSNYRAHVPKELDAIVMKALAREPDERWQSTREMGRALREFIGTRTELMGPAELSEWMGEVFPQGEARKSQLMEVARLGHDSVPAIPSAEDEATQTGTGLIADRLLPSAPFPLRPRWIALAAIALIGTMVGLGFVLSGPGDEAMSPSRIAAAPGQSPGGADAPVAAGEGEAREDAEAAPNADAPVGGDKVDAASPTTPELTETTAPGAKKRASARTKRRSRPKAPASREPGTINLVTRGGWAEIYDGKKLLGSTPRRLTLPAGKHRLVLKPFGDGQAKPIVVRAEAGKTKQVSIRLD
ncbi:MAG: serine/threonine-protein kinase [Myxococcota bacterium]